MNIRLRQFLALLLSCTILVDPRTALGMTEKPISPMAINFCETEAIMPPAVFPSRLFRIPEAAYQGMIEWWRSPSYRFSRSSTLYSGAPVLAWLLLQSTSGDVNPLYMIIALGILVGIILAFVAGYHASKKEQADADASARHWLLTTYPNQAEEILQTRPIGFVRFMKNDPNVVAVTGPFLYLSLLDALNMPSNGFDTFVKFVFPKLVSEHYDLSDPNVLLKKSLIFEGFRLAREATVEDFDTGSQSPYLDKAENEVLIAMEPLVRNSPILLDGPLPEKSPLLLLRDRLKKRVDLEANLLREFDRRVGAEIGIDGGGAYSEAPYFIKEKMRGEEALRVRLRGLDEELNRLRARLPEMNLPSAAPEVPMFPQMGSTPGKTPRPVDPETLRAGEWLLDFLSNRPFSHVGGAKTGIIVVGSDYRNVPVHAAVRWVKSKPHPAWILLVGSQGGLRLPPGFQSEAQYFHAVMKVSGMDVPENIIFEEDQSRGVIDHIKMSLGKIRELGLPISDGVMVSMAPYLQRRTIWILEKQLKDMGVKIHIESISPFRDYYIAPNGWADLNEWRRRLLYESAREIAQILGAKKLHEIEDTKETRIPQIYIKAAIRAGEHILADDSVPENDKKDMEGYLVTLREEDARIQAILDRPSFGYTSSTTYRNFYLSWLIATLTVISDFSIPLIAKIPGVMSLVSWIRSSPLDKMIDLHPYWLALSVTIAAVSLPHIWKSRLVPAFSNLRQRFA